MFAKIINNTTLRGGIAMVGEVVEVTEKEFKALSQGAKAVLVTEEDRLKAMMQKVEVREADIKKKLTTRKSD